jgi:dTDP-4-dehydrorhamnose 3,5-epimerase
MKITQTALEGVLIIEPRRFDDGRGFFSETYSQSKWAEHGLAFDWVQDNHSRSISAGVIRGLHWQNPPYAQVKLVRVTRGRILDVVVDIRTSSPTYGQHVGVELSEDNWCQLLVPAGFAHGFCTLTEVCEVQYKVTAPYMPACEDGLNWSDPSLGINWPLGDNKPMVSDRDQNWPSFENLKSQFI